MDEEARGRSILNYGHALVLSGGGAKGAYEAAAAKRIIEHYSGTDLDIRLIAGTSVGALNAAGIASGGPGFPVSLWKTVTKSDVMRDSRTRAQT
jgi:NTE family protein